MRRKTAAFAAWIFCTVPAYAMADTAGIQQAKLFFDLGAQAYSAGRYSVAVQAFDQAFRLAPRPAIAFSLAQAERKQYFVGKDATLLRRAIEHYHAYLDQVPSGGRRSDATDAIGELEPIAQRMAPGEGQGPAPAVQAPSTSIAVSSPTQGAIASIDHGPPVPLPIMAEVKPGKHQVHLSAPGYIDADRDVTAVPGTPWPLEVALTERPALVTITTGASAEISIDGRAVGTTPLSQPLQLSSGTHLIVIARNGYKAYTRELTVERGQSAAVPVSFERSGQRVVSYLFLGAGVASLLTSGVFLGLTLSAQGQAKTIYDRGQSQNLTGLDLTNYASDVDARNTWRPVAAATLAGGLAAVAIGTILYTFDHPSVTGAASQPREKQGPSPSAPARSHDMEMSAVPLVGPGLVGASLGGRF